MPYLTDATNHYEVCQLSTTDMAEISSYFQVILGSARLAKQITDKVVADTQLSEFALIRRLRLLIEHEPQLLTSKQAEKLKAALNLGLKLTQPGLKTGLVIEQPQLAAVALYPHLSWL
jgi:hypothetical protein